MYIAVCIFVISLTSCNLLSVPLEMSHWTNPGFCPIPSVILSCSLLSTRGTEGKTVGFNWAMSSSRSLMLPWYCNMCRRGAKDNMLIYQVVVIVGQLLSWNYAFDIFGSDPFSVLPLNSSVDQWILSLGWPLLSSPLLPLNSSSIV